LAQDQSVILWFRRDLRTSDNLALLEASKYHKVLPIYIYNPKDFFGGASKWWLHKSLESLDRTLQGKLNVYVGDEETIIEDLIKKLKCSKIFWNKVYEPNEEIKDQSLLSLAQKRSVECKSFNSSLLWNIEDLNKSDGGYYKVYTAFWNFLRSKIGEPRIDLDAPKHVNYIKDSAVAIKDLKLLSINKWYLKFEKIWTPGEMAANQMLKKFLASRLNGYDEKRNYPDLDSTSKLSSYLHFGEISVNKIWHVVNESNAPKKDKETFLKELVWREFSYYLLKHFPNLSSNNYQSKFDKFSWKNNDVLLKFWQKGITGYPIIDAGMRELWQTGVMHNRIRMIVASFLVKNLLIDWRLGAQWFLDCLVDADLASNSNNWQWVAGSGVDHAPYFRIFNPVLQGQKFDSEGKYIKKFVPELKRLPTKYLFAPWLAPEAELFKAGVVLGDTYPKPIVDFLITRNLALQGYKKIS